MAPNKELLTFCLRVHRFCLRANLVLGGACAGLRAPQVFLHVLTPHSYKGPPYLTWTQGCRTWLICIFEHVSRAHVTFPYISSEFWLRLCKHMQAHLKETAPWCISNLVELKSYQTAEKSCKKDAKKKPGWASVRCGCYYWYFCDARAKHWRTILELKNQTPTKESISLRIHKKKHKETRFRKSGAQIHSLPTVILFLCTFWCFLWSWPPLSWTLTEQQCFSTAGRSHRPEPQESKRILWYAQWYWQLLMNEQKHGKNKFIQIPFRSAWNIMEPHLQQNRGYEGTTADLHAMDPNCVCLRTEIKMRNLPSF